MDKNDVNDTKKPNTEKPDLKEEAVSQESSPEKAPIADALKEDEVVTPSPEAKPLEIHKKGKFRQFWATKKGKAIVIITAIIVVLAVLMAVPFTRYKILGTFVKKNSDVVVLDSVTKKPVSEAEVKLGDYSAKTDNSGKAALKDIPLGEYKLHITKNYYTSYESNVTLPIFGAMPETSVGLVATGRQVAMMVTDTITKKPVEKAKITVGDTSSTTNAEGLATIVLPADQQSLQGIVSLEGYNETAVNVAVTDQADGNKFTITPSGMVYFLSKQTGKINIMKSNLDGTNPKVVIEGTGNENDRETVLLASRDWRYMALHAKRKPNDKNAQLYLLDSKTDTLKLVDEGDASMTLGGWSEHNFVYTITRNNKELWADKRQALKNYNADTGSLAVSDETFGAGTNYNNTVAEQLGNPYILGNKVVYAKSLTNMTGSDRKASIIVLTPTNNQKNVVKEFAVGKEGMYIDAKLYKPQELYFRVATNKPVADFYEYEGGSVKSATSNDDKFYNAFYPTFLYSPNGQKTFWHEPRNGKNAIFIGNQDAGDSVEIAQQSDYATYGWYTDKYILLNKNGSELYVASSDQPLTSVPQKIANYHKPALSFPGYGAGYGGL